MGANTKIEWTDHTFNPWTGCTKVSEGCKHCYAEGWAKRSGLVQWGPGGTRRRTADGNWLKPLAWNRVAAKSGVRASVFCASLADVMDDHPSIKDEWRRDVGSVIEETSRLDWLLLTKRPENLRRFLPVIFSAGTPANVRIGVTAENQENADRRIPELLRRWSGPTFVSAEPLLGPIDFSGLGAVDWIIAGGESGGSARTMDSAWARDIRDQCAAGGVPFFMKQMTKKAEIPVDLLVRELPL